jgi:S1-C subfamily serine protease
VRTVPDGSAAKAGLQAASVQRTRTGYLYQGGDIIVAINGQDIRTRDELTLYLEDHTRPGDTAVLSVYRGGQTIDVPVTIGEQ